MNSLFEKEINEVKRIEYLTDITYGHKDWTMVEAIRELLANMIDTKTKYVYGYNKEKGYAELIDEGDGLSLKHFVFGGTTKSENDLSTIGQFGEGMKMAFLVALRENKNISVQTVNFGIEIDSKYSEDFESTLMYLIQTDNTRLKGTCVRVECTEEEWKNAVDLFFELKQNYKKLSDNILLPSGYILVSGVVTENLSNYLFSYNLEDKTLSNRDRNSIKIRDLKSRIQDILNSNINIEVIQSYLENLMFDSEFEEYKIELNPINGNLWYDEIIKKYGDKVVYSNNTETDIKAKSKGYSVIPTGNRSLRNTFKNIGIVSSKDVTQDLKNVVDVVIEDNTTEQYPLRLMHSIKESYVKNNNWNVIKAGRELFSNALDESKETARIYYENGRCVIEDNGRGISKNNFLLGSSDNKSDKQKIGQYGEGLPLSILILTRENRNIIIESKDNIFKNYFIQSKEFSDKILCTEINKNTEFNGTRITFEATEKEVEDIKSVFLMFNDGIERIDLGDIEIILGRPGIIYVKGIECENKKMLFSYNLKNDDLLNSRDRNSVKEDKFIKLIETNIGNITDERILTELFTLWYKDKKAIDCFEYGVNLSGLMTLKNKEMIQKLFEKSCVADRFEPKYNFLSEELEYNVLFEVPHNLIELFSNALGTATEIGKQAEKDGGLLKDKVIITCDVNWIAKKTIVNALVEFISNAIDADEEGYTIEFENNSAIICNNSISGIEISNFSIGSSLSAGEGSKQGKFGIGLIQSVYIVLKQTKLENFIVYSNQYAYKCYLKYSCGIESLIVKREKASEVLLNKVSITVPCTEKEYNTAKSNFLMYSECKELKSLYLVNSKSTKKFTLCYPGGCFYYNKRLLDNKKDFFFSYHFENNNSIKNFFDVNRNYLDIDKNEDIIIDAFNYIDFEDSENKLLIIDLLFSKHKYKELHILCENFDSLNQKFISKCKSLVENYFKEKRYIKFCLSSQPEYDVRAEYLGWKILDIPFGSELNTFLYKLGILNSKDALGNCDLEVDCRVDEGQLTEKERKNWNMLKHLINLALPDVDVKNMYICNSIIDVSNETVGVYLPEKDIIYVCRSELKDSKRLFSVGLHEIVHKVGGNPDISKEFESDLSKYLGLFALLYFEKYQESERFKIESEPQSLENFQDNSNTVYFEKQIKQLEKLNNELEKKNKNLLKQNDDLTITNNETIRQNNYLLKQFKRIIYIIAILISFGILYGITNLFM